MNCTSYPVGRHRQRGMGIWGGLMIALIIITLALGAMRLAPHYFDFEMVKGVLDRLPSDQVHSMTKPEIREHFSKQFRVEGFRMPLKELLEIDRNRERTVLNVNYEIREHLFANVDIVLVFGEQREYQ